MFAAIVVWPEINCFLVQILEQLLGDLGHADFRVAHRGRVITVDGAEVALAVYQHVTQRKILRHPHNRVVNRRVTVRMVLADNVADDTGGFLVRFIVIVGQFMHRIQHAAMYWFQSIPHVG